MDFLPALKLLEISFLLKEDLKFISNYGKLLQALLQFATKFLNLITEIFVWLM